MPLLLQSLNQMTGTYLLYQFCSIGQFLTRLTTHGKQCVPFWAVCVTLHHTFERTAIRAWASMNSQVSCTTAVSGCVAPCWPRTGGTVHASFTCHVTLIDLLTVNDKASKRELPNYKRSHSRVRSYYLQENRSPGHVKVSSALAYCTAECQKSLSQF